MGLIPVREGDKRAERDAIGTLVRIKGFRVLGFRSESIGTLVRIKDFSEGSRTGVAPGEGFHG